MDPRTATLLGYTQDELEANFPDYIERLAATGSAESERLEIARRMWDRGIAPAIIAEVTGLSAGF